MLLKTDESESLNSRKYVQVKILKSIRLRLDSGLDQSIINVHTWKKLGRGSIPGLVIPKS